MGKLNKNNIVGSEKQGKSKANASKKKNDIEGLDNIALNKPAAKLNKAKKLKQHAAIAISSESVPTSKPNKAKKPAAVPVDTSVADSHDSDSENEKELADSAALPRQQGGMCYIVTNVNDIFEFLFNLLI